jgi:prevent-host-death family protein
MMTNVWVNCSTQRQNSKLASVTIGKWHKFAILLETGLKKRLKGCIIALSGYCNLLGENFMNTQVSIGQVKRDISELVNRVSYAGERIILTSRGKPKAALINIEDYERLLKSENRAADVQKWLADTRALSKQIEKRQGLIDVDGILAADRDDLEQR